ncbi:MAG: response regulator transcription factor [Chloroflexota bacterium]|nr:response regulator transcription factor [Chloroflexota bacterium]
MEKREKVRLLIVDDHDMVRKGLMVLLENFPEIEVVSDVRDGQAAVDVCRYDDVDVVLMDMIMPRMDGVTATKIIREISPTTQVIVLTSFSEEQNVQAALKAGAIGYLLKNVSGEELAAAIQRARNEQSTLSPEAAQALIRATTRPPMLGHDLTEREREVLTLMIRGLSNREIAEELVISSSTVKNHVSNILSKLGTISRTQAVALAVESKLMSS